MKSEKVIQKSLDRLTVDVRGRSLLGDVFESVDPDVASEIEEAWFTILSDLWQEGYDKGYEDGYLDAEDEWMGRS